MDDEILDSDGLKPDTKFLTFIRKEKLYFYSILNILFFIFCASYFLGPVDIDSAIYLVFIYTINNLWLFLSYLTWRKETIEKHYDNR